MKRTEKHKSTVSRWATGNNIKKNYLKLRIRDFIFDAERFFIFGNVGILVFDFL